VRVFQFAVAAILLVLRFPAEAQQPTKVPRIGFLIVDSPSAASTRVEAFKKGLQELGYVEGKNITLEYRYAEGKADRLPQLATNWSASILMFWLQAVAIRLPSLR
jgi:putative tryptophan/tyrosine transport system substrate-binding protein